VKTAVELEPSSARNRKKGKKKFRKKRKRKKRKKEKFKKVGDFILFEKKDTIAFIVSWTESIVSLIK